MPDFDFDLVVIGSGPAGHHAAIQAAKLRKRVMVIGAGVIGCEYASIFAALGVRVTLIDKRPRLLPFVDAELIETLDYHLRAKRVLLRLGELGHGKKPISTCHDEPGESGNLNSIERDS